MRKQYKNSYYIHDFILYSYIIFSSFKIENENLQDVVDQDLLKKPKSQQNTMRIPQTLSNNIYNNKIEEKQKYRYEKEIENRKSKDIDINTQLFSYNVARESQVFDFDSDTEQDKLKQLQIQQNTDKQQTQNVTKLNTSQVKSKSGSRRFIRSRSGTLLSQSSVQRSMVSQNNQINNLVSSISILLDAEELPQIKSQPIQEVKLTDQQLEMKSQSETQIQNKLTNTYSYQRMSHTKLVRSPMSASLKQKQYQLKTSDFSRQQSVASFSLDTIQKELNNFEPITASSIQLSKRQLPQNLQKIQKEQLPSNIEQLFLTINDKNADWQQKYNSLQKIQKICKEDQNQIKDFQQYFIAAQTLLKDLRSALVQQTIETTNQIYLSYSNTRVLYKNQEFAGNPSIQNFLGKQTDIAIQNAISNILCFNSSEGISNSILTDHIIQNFKPQTSIGSKIRYVHYLADNIILSHANEDQISTQMHSLLENVLTTYNLTIDNDRGFISNNSDNHFEEPCDISKVCGKLNKMIRKYSPQISQIISKYSQDGDAELRKAIRRLYYVCRQTEIFKNLKQDQKIDKFIQKEGITNSWWFDR